jgi:Na+/H+ antiporter NhaD/arsenite permease-like protein
MESAVILLAMVGVAVGRIPYLRMNRATIALAGAAALIALGTLTPEAAFGALDLDTLVLIFAMMIINVNLKLSGFFDLVGRRIMRVASTPRLLLALVILSSGVFSALFLNDTVVLMFTPLVASLTVALKRDPIPYMMGLATAANIGSMATIIGNPQNMLIGASSGIGFLSFTARLAVPSALGLAAAWLILVLIYRREFTEKTAFNAAAEQALFYRPLLVKSLVAVVLLLGLTVAGVRVSVAVLCSSALLLVTRRIKPARVFREIDWSLLVLFSGLFVITEAIRTVPITNRLLEAAVPLADRSVAAFSGIAALLSNLISNVPAVMVMRPIVPALANPERGWLVLAMATTLAGNFTLLGSIANLIVAESASRHGVDLSFRRYLTAGVPITLVTIAIGILWFSLAMPA